MHWDLVIKIGCPGYKKRYTIARVAPPVGRWTFLVHPLHYLTVQSPILVYATHFAIVAGSWTPIIVISKIERYGDGKAGKFVLLASLPVHETS